MVALLNVLDALAVGTSLLGDGGEGFSSDVLDYTDKTPWQRLAMANNHGIWHGMDPPLRMLGAFFASDARDIPSQGAAYIATWIRNNITYAQEAPGVELLQGPYDTLKYRTGDCDDMAILFLALTRAIGLTTYMAGICQLPDREILLHAVGWQGGLDLNSDLGSVGTFYELIDDRRYGGQNNGLIFHLPEGYAGVVYSPEPDTLGFWMNDGTGFLPWSE